MMSSTAKQHAHLKLNYHRILQRDHVNSHLHLGQKYKKRSNKNAICSIYGHSTNHKCCELVKDYMLHHSRALRHATWLNNNLIAPTSQEVIDLDNAHIQPSESVRSLGVVIDSTLSFDAHVNSVCKAANYHAKALRHIRKRVTTDVAVSIASTMVGARLDYCNAILYGTSKSNIQKLQRAQNSIARIVTGTRRSEHITPVLAQLHWLKIAERIEYKVALLTFKALTTGKPTSFNSALQ
jgi:hypothetical protein